MVLQGNQVKVKKIEFHQTDQQTNLFKDAPFKPDNPKTKPFVALSYLAPISNGESTQIPRNRSKRRRLEKVDLGVKTHGFIIGR